MIIQLFINISESLALTLNLRYLTRDNYDRYKVAGF